MIMSETRSNDSVNSQPSSSGKTTPTPAANAKKNLAAPPLTFDNVVSPCGHNCWDNRRVKRHVTTLQCRICNAPWKIVQPIRMVCEDYHQNRGCCPAGASCPYIHLNRPNFEHTLPQKRLGEDIVASGENGTENAGSDPRAEKADPELLELLIELLNKQGGIGTRVSVVVNQALKMLHDRRSPNTDPVEPASDMPPAMPTPIATTVHSQEEEASAVPTADRDKTLLLMTQLGLGHVSPDSTTPPPVRRQASPSVSSSSSTSSLTSPRLLPITARFVPTQRSMHRRGSKDVSKDASQAE